jgi:hypothetical protein
VEFLHADSVGASKDVGFAGAADRFGNQLAVEYRGQTPRSCRFISAVIEELLREVFSVRSVSRCYMQDKSRF